MKNIFKILPIVGIMAISMPSCNNDTDIPDLTESPKPISLSNYELIKSFSENEGEFESMLKIFDAIPELKTLVMDETSSKTIFAVKDESVNKALVDLNRYRADNKLGRALTLDDLLIEPFEVIDTIPPVTEMMDTTYIVRKYDYKADLEGLMCRYLFDTQITYKSVEEDGGRSLVEALKTYRQMMVETTRDNASGLVGSGVRSLNLIERNGSAISTKWMSAEVEKMDILTTDGVIHVISPNHIFGFGEMLNLFKDYGNERN